MSMRIAMLMDRERLHHERRLLANLSRALSEREVMQIHIVPEGLEPPLWEGVSAPPNVELHLETTFRGSPWLRSLRLRQLVQAIDRDLPDALVAIGKYTWPLAIALGRALDRPVALECWTRSMVQQIPRGRHAGSVAAFIAPTESLTRLVAGIVGTGMAAHVPWGVPVAAERVLDQVSEGDSPWRDDDAWEEVLLVITGSCRDVAAYQSLLSGLSRVIRELPHAQTFLELGGDNEHEIWRIVSHLGLHANVTVTPDAAGPEQLLTRCHALLLPERYGQMRSILLDGMSSSMAIIGAEDPALDMLIDEQTALTLPNPDAGDWAAAIRRVVADRPFAWQLGQAARDYATQRHSLSNHAEALCETLRRTREGEVLHFPAT